MPGTLETVKSTALETYVTLCSADARRIRTEDERRQPRCLPGDDRTHLRAAADWLCRAHDMGTDDGVSAMFSMIEGWMGSYPETTGYIIPTFFDLARREGVEEYRARAVEMADWLLTQQLRDGAYPGSFVGRLTGPRVFNTGQVLLGLLRAGVETKNSGYVDAAVRAGDWLLRQQDDDGAWRRLTLAETVHAYNVRTAWALALLAAETGERRFRKAAVANANWTAGHQDDSGWFRHNTFHPGEGHAASLHTIAYAARGLLEIGDVTGRPEFIESADRAASALHRGWRLYHEIGGAYERDWSVPVSWRCLPGEAQLVVVWLRLDQISGSRDYRDTAVALIERAKSAQILDGANPDLCGGVTGSVPINGGYERYCVVNWGAKFLIDALLLKASTNGEHPTA